MKSLLLACIALQVGAGIARPLERGNGPEPSTLDPHRCPEVACGNIVRDLYEGLVSEDAAGRIVPGAADHWDVSADGRTWTFHLRSDLRWSNGETLDAPQFVASFRRAFAPPTAAPAAVLLDVIAAGAQVRRGLAPPEALGVSAPDRHTVAFRLERTAPLPDLLVLPVAMPVHLPSVAAYGVRHTQPGQHVGNGPYRLAGWTPQLRVELEANPHYHTPAPITRVRFHVTEDAAAELKRFQAGDLHITETVPPGRIDVLRERFGAALHIAPYLGSFWLGYNVERAPFRDARALREALSLALDRERLTTYITALGEQPAYGLVPPGIEGHTPARVDWADWPQARREARARALYAAAGYGPQHPLEIELRFNTSTPHRRLALAVAAMWRQVLGVHTRLRNEEWKVFVQNRRQRAITQVFRGGWIGDVPDAANFLAPFRGDAGLDWTGWRDARFLDLLRDADTAPTLQARDATLVAAEQRVLDAHVVIPLYHYSAKHLVDPRLDGFEANPLDRHPSRWLSWRDQAYRVSGK